MAAEGGGKWQWARALAAVVSEDSGAAYFGSTEGCALSFPMHPSIYYYDSNHSNCARIIFGLICWSN